MNSSGRGFWAVFVVMLAACVSTAGTVDADAPAASSDTAKDLDRTPADDGDQDTGDLGADLNVSEECVPDLAGPDIQPT